MHNQKRWLNFLRVRFSAATLSLTCRLFWLSKVRLSERSVIAPGELLSTVAWMLFEDPKPWVRWVIRPVGLLLAFVSANSDISFEEWR